MQEMAHVCGGNGAGMAMPSAAEKMPYTVIGALRAAERWQKQAETSHNNAQSTFVAGNKA